MKNWLITLGALLLMALIIFGVDIVSFGIFLAFLLMIVIAVMDGIEERKKKKSKDS